MMIPVPRRLDRRALALMGCLALAALVFGCGTEASSPDGGASNGPDGALPDFASVPDPGHDRGTSPPHDLGYDPGKSDPGGPIDDDTLADVTPDLTPTACQGLCPPGQGCHAGVCLEECGAGTLGQLVAALAPGVSPLANYCGAADQVYAYAALPTWELLEVVAEDSGPDSVLKLRRWPFYTPHGREQAVELATLPVTGSVSLWEVLPGGFLSIDIERNQALWGYVRTAAGYPGQALTSALDVPAAPGTHDAPGLSSATLIGQGMLASGLGLGSVQGSVGLYYLDPLTSLNAQAATALGSTVGAVSAWGDFVLVTGYSESWQPCDPPEVPPDATAGTRVFALGYEPLVNAVALGAPLAARCNAQELDIGADARFLSDGRILSREGSGKSGLVVRHWSYGPTGELALASPEPITVAPSLSVARDIPGSNLLVLQHDDGYLLVDGPPLMQPPSPPEPDPGPELAAGPEAVEGAEVVAAPDVPSGQ